MIEKQESKVKQSECPVCGRDVLADFPGLRSVCPQCEKQLALKEELVDLRMHLANAENQALKIVDKLIASQGEHMLDNSERGLTYKARNVCLNIKKADNELCDIAKEMKLDKIGLVEPRKYGETNVSV